MKNYCSLDLIGVYRTRARYIMIYVIANNYWPRAFILSVVQRNRTADMRPVTSYVLIYNII